MVVGFLSSFLVAVTLSGPTVEQLDDDRFRVKVVFDDTSVRGNLAAQDAVARKAHETCRGRGTAVSDCTVEVRDAQPARADRKAYELAEIYICAPVWDQPARRLGN